MSRMAYGAAGRRVIVLGLLGVGLWGAGACAAGLGFEKLTLPAAASSASVRLHPVNVLGGPEMEIVAVNADGNVTIFSQVNNTLAPVQTLALPLPPGKDQHVFYGFARVVSPDQYSLMVLGPGNVNYYPIENNVLAANPLPLFNGKLVSGATPGPTHRPFDMAIDMNGDGFDEILLPSDNGFSISTRQGDGKYGTVELPRKAFKVKSNFTFSNDIPPDPTRPAFYTVQQSKTQGVEDLLFFDANGDRKLDLIYSSTAVGPDSKQVERYDVFLQKDKLSFGAKPDQSIAIPYDSQANATFRDMNNDGRLDAVLVRSNLDIVNPRTLVKFYVGSSQDYQVFNRETDRFITKDPVGLVQLNDFNNDGAMDFAMTFFSYQFGSMEDIIDLAFANKIQFRLQFYLGRGKEGFTRKPDMELPITLNTKLENFRGNPPVMVIKDINGDKLMDLAVRNSATQLQLFVSTGNYTISPSPIETFKIPEKAALDFTDINGDGLTDIIVSDPSTNTFSIIQPKTR